MTPFGASLPSAKFDLTLIASEVADGLRVSIVYSTDLFDAATIERMLRHFGMLLEGVIADPATPRLQGCRSSPRKKQRKLLVECNQTAADFPQDTRLHELS